MTKIYTTERTDIVRLPMSLSVRQFALPYTQYKVSPDNKAKTERINLTTKLTHNQI